jgi:hypothetical protein
LNLPLAELFVCQTVLLDPAARITMEQCCHHPLFWDGGLKLVFLKTIWEQNAVLLQRMVPAENWQARLPYYLQVEYTCFLLTFVF